MGNRIRIFILLFVALLLPFMLGMTGKEEYKRDEKVNNNTQINAIMPLNNEEYGATSEEILSEFSTLLPDGQKDFATVEGLRSAISFEAILAEFFASSEGAFSRIVYFLATSVGVAVILSVCEILWTSGEYLVRLPVSAAASLAVYNMLLPVVEEVSDALFTVSEFFSGLSGILTTLTLSLGGAGLASVQASGMLFTLSVYGNFSSSFLMSIVTMVFATALVGAACSGKAERLASGVKTVFNVGLGLLTAALLGLLSLQNLIAGASDSAALRAARYAVSGLVPVVGSTVSSALATLSSGLSYVGQIVGGASVAVILSITLAPAIILLLYRLALSLVLMLLDFAEAKNATSVFKALRGALDTLISVYFMSSVVYIFEIVLFVKCGVGLV